MPLETIVDLDYETAPSLLLHRWVVANPQIVADWWAYCDANKYDGFNLAKSENADRLFNIMTYNVGLLRQYLQFLVENYPSYTYLVCKVDALVDLNFALGSKVRR